MPDQSFGATLRRLREAAGLTQEALAERAGLTAKAISALERGDRRRPYPQTVLALANALGLIGGERDALIGTAPQRLGMRFSSAPENPGFSLPLPPTPLIGRERAVAAILSP